LGADFLGKPPQIALSDLGVEGKKFGILRRAELGGTSAFFEGGLLLSSFFWATGGESVSQ
jgi:hypothetical protein